MRWGSAVVGVVLVGLAVVLFTGWTPKASWAPWTWAQHERRAQLDAATVRLDVESGGVTLRRGDVDRIELVARSRAWQDPGETWRRDGDVLELRDCGWRCSVGYDLVVPPGTRVEGTSRSGSVRVTGAAAVDVSARSGSVEIRDVPGTVRASTNSGSVVLDRVGGAVTAESSSGSVTGRDLAGPVDASTSSGKVTVSLVRPQDVRAETSSGSVEVAVPAGRYRIPDGRHLAGVVDDPSARYALELRTSSGDLLVRAR